MVGLLKEIILEIAGVCFLFTSEDVRLSFNQESGIKYFLAKDINSDVNIKVFCRISDKEFYSSEWISCFTGVRSYVDNEDYLWSVYQKGSETLIRAQYFHHCFFSVIELKMTQGASRFDLNIIPINVKRDENVSIDPLIHPIGSLFLLYVMLQNNGVLIHASGVLWNNQGFLFTGVSGIGKSTMAKLWADSGGEVLNDDRIVIRVDSKNEVKIYNNPMPYYKQKPKKGVLKKIFLLKQSSSNYIKPVNGVAAFSRVMGNFIQQFYQKKMIHLHLSIIDQILRQVKVYELGFKPDQDIIDLIKKLD